MTHSIFLTPYTYGPDAYEHIAAVCAPLGKKLLPIGGNTALAAALPFLERALAPTTTELLDAFWYGGNCTQETITVLAHHAETAGAQIIAGVGGGKAIDTAKAVAYKLGLPFLSLPTVATCCAAVTDYCVVYDARGLFSEYLKTNAIPIHCFLQSEIITTAPSRFLQSGMAAAIAMQSDCHVATRGKALHHASRLAKEVSRTISLPLMRFGDEALELCAARKTGAPLEECILTTVITTGYAAMLLRAEQIGGMANATALGLLRQEEAQQYSYGALAGYGALLCLLLEDKTAQAQTLQKQLQAWNCPVYLESLGQALEWMALSDLMDEILAMPDLTTLPYRITSALLFNTIRKAEQLGTAPAPAMEDESLILETSAAQ